VLAVTFWVILQIISFPERRRRKRKEDWENWNKALDLSKHATMFRIVSIRQQARTGTKAYVVFQDTKERSAVWIPELLDVERGEYMVVHGSYGHGRHHDEQVFYVNHVLQHMDKQTYKGWKKHEKRIAKLTRQLEEATGKKLTSSDIESEKGWRFRDYNGGLTLQEPQEEKADGNETYLR